MKTHLAYIAIILALLFAACWGWSNFLGEQMVSRGDLREASYLVSEFTEFSITNDRLPTPAEASSFRTRLMFVGAGDDRYTYKCGLYGRDHFIIERDGNDRFQFWVHVGPSN